YADEISDQGNDPALAAAGGGADHRRPAASAAGAGRTADRHHRDRRVRGHLHDRRRRRLGQRQEAHRGRAPRRQGQRGPQGRGDRRYRRRSLQGHRRPRDQPADQDHQHRGIADGPAAVAAKHPGTQGSPGNAGAFLSSIRPDSSEACLFRHAPSPHTAAMRARTRTRRVGFLAFDGLTALDLVGPAEVFALASALSPATRGSRPLYEVVVIGLDAEPIRAHSGVLLAPQATLTVHPPLDTIFIPGGRGLRESGTLPIVADWLRKRRRSFRRIVSACTGAWALAEAGLLDGGSATTHWNHSAELARRYPSVRVEADAIYVREGNIYTSAGITAGVDLAL